MQVDLAQQHRSTVCRACSPSTTQPSFRALGTGNSLDGSCRWLSDAVGPGLVLAMPSTLRCRYSHCMPQLPALLPLLHETAIRGSLQTLLSSKAEA